MSSAHVGSPIRKSAGQRMLAPHRSLSQLATSFIASKCQGIHRVPLDSYLPMIFIADITLARERLLVFQESVVMSDNSHYSIVKELRTSTMRRNFNFRKSA